MANKSPGGSLGTLLLVEENDIVFLDRGPRYSFVAQLVICSRIERRRQWGNGEENGLLFKYWLELLLPLVNATDFLRNERKEKKKKKKHYIGRWLEEAKKKGRDMNSARGKVFLSFQHVLLSAILLPGFWERTGCSVYTTESVDTVKRIRTECWLASSQSKEEEEDSKTTHNRFNVQWKNNTIVSFRFVGIRRARNSLDKNFCCSSTCDQFLTSSGWTFVNW